MQELVAATKALKAGRLAEAEQLCRRALSTDPGNAFGLSLLGVMAGQRGDHAQAAELMQQAVARDPANVAFRINLVTALIELGRFQEAEVCLQEAMRQTAAQSNPQLWNLWGAVKMHQGDSDTSIAALKKSLAMNPQQPMAQFNLAEAYRRAKHFGPAIEHLRKCLELEPRNIHALNNLAGLHLSQGDLANAIICLRSLVQLDPHNVKSLFDLVQLYCNMGEVDEAAGYLRRLEQLGEDKLQVHVGRAWVADRRGDLEAAAKHITHAYELAPTDGDVASIFANIHAQRGNTEQAIAALEEFLRQCDGDAVDTVGLQFTLGKLYDQTGRYEEAFQQMKQANGRRRTALGSQFSRDPWREEIDRLVNAYPPAVFAGLPSAKNDSSLPIFIIGMPRSGTSLVEQILASHPDVHGGGELPDLPQLMAKIRSASGDAAKHPPCNTAEQSPIQNRYFVDPHGLTAELLNSMADVHLQRLRQLGGNASRVTDKLPYNFLAVGLLTRLFPAATIIHCRRHPLDICLSCYFHNFLRGNHYTFDLQDLKVYYRQYERVMEHWQKTLQIQLLDVQYEQLVSEPESQVCALLEYCQLPWDDRCLQFHRSKRVVATASYQQVRQPIYTKSVGRWKHYERQLQREFGNLDG